MTTTCHETRLQCSAYLDGLLSPEQQAALERHLDDCSRCQADVQALKQMLASLRTLTPPEAPPLLPGIHAKLRRQPLGRRLASAFLAPWPQSLPLHGLAAVAVAVLVIVVSAPQLSNQTADRKAGRPPAEVLPASSAVETAQERDAQRRQTWEEGNAFSAPAPEQRRELAMRDAFTRAADSVAEKKERVDEPQRRSGDETAKVVGAAMSGGQFALSPVPPTVRWSVKDVPEATAQVQAWVDGQGGSVSAQDPRHLVVMLPAHALDDFLRRFSTAFPASSTGDALQRPPAAGSLANQNVLAEPPAVPQLTGQGGSAPATITVLLELMPSS